jgi:hypothetical protein
MQRQAIIYSAYAGIGTALFVYLLTLCATAWQHFGLSGTFALVGALAGVFAALTAFNGWVAYLFKRRAVAAIQRGEGGVLLIPDGTSFSAPVSTRQVRVVRRFGEQLARNEGLPKFTLIHAANKYWVTPVAIEGHAQPVAGEA